MVGHYGTLWLGAKGCVNNMTYAAAWSLYHVNLHPLRAERGVRGRGGGRSRERGKERERGRE